MFLMILFVDALLSFDARESREGDVDNGVDGLFVEKIRTRKVNSPLGISL